MGKKSNILVIFAFIFLFSVSTFAMQNVNGVVTNPDSRDTDDIISQGLFKMGAQVEDDRSVEELLAPALEKQERERENDIREQLRAQQEAQKRKSNVDSNGANLEKAVTDYLLEEADIAGIRGWYEDPVSQNWYYILSSGSPAADYILYYQGDSFYFDERGVRVSNEIIDYKGEKYFFDQNGVMVKNRWVTYTNPEGDADQVEIKRYYFGPNGRAYRATQSQFIIKTIDDNKYAFNTEAEVLYGYIDSSGSRIDEREEHAYEDCLYYFGPSIYEPEMVTGWVMYDGEKDDDRYDVNEMYLYFSPETGKKFTAKQDDNGEEKAKGRMAVIEGATYRFDEYGVMRSGWIEDDKKGTKDVANKKYFSYDYEGWLNEGWFTAVPPENSILKTNQDRASSGDEQWFYADSKGYVVRNQIKRIGQKYFCFDVDGVMQTDVLVVVDSNGQIAQRTSDMTEDNDYPCFKTSDISKKMIFEPNSTDSDDILKLQNGYKLKYFTESQSEESSVVDGSMLYGSSNIELTLKDMDAQFKSNANGSFSNVDVQKTIKASDGKIYQNGFLVAADKNSKYGIYMADHNDTNSYGVVDVKGKPVTGNACRKVGGSYLFVGENKYLGSFNCEVKADNNGFAMYKDEGESKSSAKWKYFYEEGKNGSTKINVKDFNKDTVPSEYNILYASDDGLYINFTEYKGDAPSDQ